MSDIEVPNIVFDTETSLTEGPQHDDFPGTSGNDKFIGAVATGGNSFTTLNPADIIRGGDGGDDMLSVTFTGGSPQAVGFFTENLDVFQIRNFVSGTAGMNMIDVTGTDTLWFDNNTGDTDLTFVQNLMDVVVTGGLTDLDINYVASVAAGANQDQEILVEGTGVPGGDETDIDIVGGVQNLWLTANGAASNVDINSAATSMTVMGDAPSVMIKQGGAFLSSFDSTAFEGAVDAELDMDNGPGVATVNTLKGKDTLELDGDGGDLFVKSRNGGDDIDIWNFDDVVVKAGKGHDEVEVDASGTVDVFGGKGEDTIRVNTGDTVNIDSGDKSDDVTVERGGNTGVVTGTGSDVVSTGSIYGTLNVDLGGGNSNSLSSGYVAGNASVDGGSGNDNVSISDARGYVTVNLGDGTNTANLSNNSASYYEDLTVNGGTGVDNVTIRGNADLFANLGDSNDTVNLQGGHYNIWDKLGLTLGEGDDTVNMGSNYLRSNDTITGGAGDDVINANYIYQFGGSAFNSTTGVQTLELNSNTSSTFYGISSGANAAGIMNYTFLSNNSPNHNLRDMVDGVTLNMRDDGGLHYLRLDLDDAGGATTANLNFDNFDTGTGSTGFYTMDLTDVGTLNVNVTDRYGDSYTNTTVLGSGSSFIADSDLTTVNLAGSTHIHMADVAASGLTLIDGSTMSTNIFLDTDDVSDSGIAIKTGSGNDTVKRDDAASNYDIETNGGNDTVMGAGGDDNVKLGSGDDDVHFNAWTLDTFDIVDGGIGSDDELYIDNTGSDDGLTGDDAFFYGISAIEEWILSDDIDTLTLGAIAQDSGMQRIQLGNGNDLVTLEASYSNALEVTIGSSSNDTVNAGASAAALTVRADSNDIGASDVIIGGTSGGDRIAIYDVVGGAVDLTGVTNVETIATTSFQWEYQNLVIDAVEDNVDGAPGGVSTLTVNTTNSFFYYNGQGLVFNGLMTEADGNYVVTSDYGYDDIYGGALGDVINTNRLDDEVWGYGGNDTINSGSENDTVYGGDGNDSIDGGTGSDDLYGEDGNDIINAGSGGDWVDGGAEADTIDLGAADGAVDTLDYNDHSDSFGDFRDQVSNFEAGIGGDLIDLRLGDDGVQVWKGNAADYTEAKLKVEAGGDVEVVFQQDKGLLWVNLNNDGDLNQDDLAIDLIGVASLDVSNLILDTTPTPL